MLEFKRIINLPFLLDWKKFSYKTVA